MSRPSSFQIRKLERQIEATGARELKHRLEVAQTRVNRRIASMARDPKAATSKRFRDALEAEITRIYASLSLDFDKWLGDIVRTGGPAWAGETAGQIMQATGKTLPLMRFDRERVQRYQEMITKENGEHLAAVFTRSMTAASIRQLRNATVDTFRQQVIEGWSANETQKRLQQSWDRLAGNESGRRFVDRGGKEWTNSRYLQMLTRTTMQRVSREIEIDTLADNGFSLARISADAGDPCQICEAWQGVIIRVAGSGQGGGRFPTYQQSLDAGMWHPNCTHRLEYIDEDLEADEIKRQAEQPSPGAWEDPDAVRAYSDGINQQRYRADGMSADEAKRAVMRDRLKDRARSGMVSERFDDAIDAITDKVLDQMRLDQLPHFRLAKKDEEGAFSRNSPKGGWVVLDRTGTGKAEFDKAFYSLQTKRGVDTKAKAKAKAVAVTEKPKATTVKVTAVKFNDQVPAEKTAKKLSDFDAAVAEVTQRGSGDELFVCIAPDGSVIRHDSDPNGGDLPMNMRIKGAEFVHNHPYGFQRINNRTLRYGTSLSVQDIRAAISVQFKKVTAVTPRRMYSLEPGKNGVWPFIEEFEKANKNARARVQRKIAKAVAKKRLTSEQTIVLEDHMINKAVAKKLGMRYSKTRLESI